VARAPKRGLSVIDKVLSTDAVAWAS
jgi:hypothetical protein